MGVAREDDDFPLAGHSSPRVFMGVVYVVYPDNNSPLYVSRQIVV